MISQYKKKLEDAHDLRKQVKATEDKNIMYMQQNQDLEEVSRVTDLWYHVTLKSIMWPFIDFGLNC